MTQADVRLNQISSLCCSMGAPYISFAPFESISYIKHGFSTRLGGISRGCYESMNIGFDRGDSNENVIENFRLLGKSIGFDYRNVVLNDQWHTTNCRVATLEDRGKGVIKSRNYKEIDGQITNEKGVVLMAYGADCVPIFFVDTKKRAIGMCHAGWKGTVHRIARVIIDMLHTEYGSEPEDVICAIGPSICRDCYEVGQEVADEFLKEFDKEQSDEENRVVFDGKRDGKYYLDLWKANKAVLIDAGISKEHIYISGMCTMCRKDLFFSHRRDGSERGSMAGFLMLC